MKPLQTLQQGDMLEQIESGPVSRIDLIKYAGASGDYNPIHTIDEEASKAGLPGIIAHGMWTMGILSRLFTPYLEEGFIQDYKIRFAEMVFLQDVVTFKATVDEISQEYIDLAVAAVKQNEKTVIKGSVRFKLY